MRFYRSTLLFLVLALLGCGEARKPEPQEDGKKKVPAKGFARTLQRENAKNELRNLAHYYLQYVDTNRGRPPATLDHFLEFFKQDNVHYKAVKEGYYIVNLKAKLGSTDIIAYEAEADEMNNVLVVRGDANVSTMSMSEVRRELEQP